MRIWVPTCREKRYFLTIYFRETGRPNYIRVGPRKLAFGKGREYAGRLARIQVEIIDCDGSIELFPGARILGIVVNEEAGIDENYEKTLNPKVDEIEFVNPHEIITMPGDLARDVAGDNPQFQKQLEVLNGKRKQFIGSK